MLRIGDIRRRAEKGIGCARLWGYTARRNVPVRDRFGQAAAPRRLPAVHPATWQNTTGPDAGHLVGRILFAGAPLGRGPVALCIGVGLRVILRTGRNGVVRVRPSAEVRPGSVIHLSPQSSRAGGGLVAGPAAPAKVGPASAPTFPSPPNQLSVPCVVGRPNDRMRGVDRDGGLRGPPCAGQGIRARLGDPLSGEVDAPGCDREGAQEAGAAEVH